MVSMAVTMHDDEANFDEVEVDEAALKEAQAEAANSVEEIEETTDKNE